MPAKQPDKVNDKWDTHTFYKTVSHLHLSMLDNSNELIDLILVECGDGRWFVEQVSTPFESDQLFDAYSSEFIEPKFYESLGVAEEIACKIITENTSLKFDEIYPYFEG